MQFICLPTGAPSFMLVQCATEAVRSFGACMETLYVLLEVFITTKRFSVCLVEMNIKGH